jgi:hypothetical protein
MQLSGEVGRRGRVAAASLIPNGRIKWVLPRPGGFAVGAVPVNAPASHPPPPARGCLRRTGGAGRVACEIGALKNKVELDVQGGFDPNKRIHSGVRFRHLARVI